MTDQYRVVRHTLSSRARLEITAREFHEVVRAVDGLGRVIDIEEAYDILISNYMEYERAVAGILIEEEVRRRISSEAFNQDRRHMSRVTANLLSSARLFRDIADNVVPKLLGRKALKEFRDEKAKVAEQSFPYRFMEELRNHSQHEHFPVTGISYGANWLGHNDEVKATRVHTFKPSVKPHLLKAFPRFRNLAAEYEEMREVDPALPEGIDLTLFVRHYVMCMGDILVVLRQMLQRSGLIEALNLTVESMVQPFIDLDGNATLMGIEAEHLRNGEVVDRRHLGSELGSVVAHLQKENRKLVNLHRIQFRL
ncbi:MAG: hypothetical protein Q7J26_01490 [Brevundimonas sp.]|uniref:hypothetical protein n=1 Tax=Brevundimonas sp. TaxID=1871086 RepID=UPI00272364E1|nr:hypothetical protein [Brevundimonas sp.]MDO9607171.1 hypothetical protein [Brevundimonas sp.]